MKKGTKFKKGDLVMITGTKGGCHDISCKECYGADAVLEVISYSVPHKKYCCQIVLGKNMKNLAGECLFLEEDLTINNPLWRELVMKK